MRYAPRRLKEVHFVRIEAFREPVMEDLMLEYLERLRLIGFQTVVGRSPSQTAWPSL